MKDYPNIVFIVFDTLRKDVLSVYGGNANTPNIDLFAKDSVVYNNAIAPSPWTIPSHASFFTGLYPLEHNIHETYEHGEEILFDAMNRFERKTIVEELQNKGYNTIGLSANIFISPGSGFDRGFNSFFYIDSEYRTQEEIEVREISKQYGATPSQVLLNLISNGKFREALNLYKKHKKILKKKKLSGYPKIKGGDIITNIITSGSYEKPFFLFINMMEIHDPYTEWEIKNEDSFLLELFKIKNVGKGVIEKIRKAYINEMNYLDFYLGQILKYLKDSKLYDNSLIILSSDHGQALKENNYYGHGTFLYNEIIEVPLIVKYPENKIIQQKNGYQSLVNVPKLIKNVVDGIYNDPITEETVFSESYGFQQNLNSISKKHKELSNMDMSAIRKMIGYPRKAIYKNNYKLVVNGLDGKVEEFTFDKKRIDIKDKKDVFKDLIEELYIFKGSEHFMLPEF